MSTAPLGPKVPKIRDRDGDSRDLRAAMLQIIAAYRLTQAVYAAVELGLPDLLADEPLPAEELARRTGAHPLALYRLLRALTSIEVLRSEAHGFALASLGEWLRTDIEGSVAPIARLFGRERMWLGWGRLAESVMTGQPSMGPRSERSFLDRHLADPEAGAIFDAAMTAMTAGHAPAVIEAYDFSPCSRIVDVGGGRGTLLAAILKANPGSRGVLFDLPPVIAAARPFINGEGLADRCELIGGDCFAGVPADGDLYVMKAVIHDWDDTRSVTILNNCRRAMRSTGRLLVVDRVLPESIEASERLCEMAFSDLNMLVLAGGRERTATEFQTLFRSAGFHLLRVVPTTLPYSLVEGVPKP